MDKQLLNKLVAEVSNKVHWADWEQNAEVSLEEFGELLVAAIEAEVRAEAQPVAYVMTEEEQSRTTLKTPIIVLGNLPRGANLFASQQLPAPCPQCAANTIFARDHYAALAKVNRLESERDALQDELAVQKGMLKIARHERDALQAKVAKQTTEIERLKSERDEYNSAWQHAGEEYRKLRDSLLSLAGAFK